MANLPDGYTQLAYIQSSGTQYINTGFNPNQDTRAIIDVQTVAASNTDNQILSCRSTANGPYWIMQVHKGNTAIWRTRYASQSTQDFSTNLNVFQRTVIDKNKNITTIGKETKTFNYVQFSIPYPLTLFARLTGNTGVVEAYSSVRLYSCKLYNDGQIVRDFVPCLNPQGAAGLYDLIGNQFYANSGTGTFSYGYIPGHLPEGFQEVTYIQSSGTQYIDTNVIPNQNTRLVGRFGVTAVSDAGTGPSFIPYGSGASYNSQAFECYSQSNQYEFNYDGQNQLLGNIALGQIAEIDHNKNVVSLTIDGAAPLTLQLTLNSFTSPYSLILFGINRGSNILGTLKLYSCKIYDNGSLVRDYVPCLDTQGTPGLFDLVGGQFYGNSGTGAFSAGPVVIPAPPIYLKSAGAWQRADSIWAKSGGTWGKASKVFGKKSPVWAS